MRYRCQAKADTRIAYRLGGSSSRELRCGPCLRHAQPPKASARAMLFQRLLRRAAHPQYQRARKASNAAPTRRRQARRRQTSKENMLPHSIPRMSRSHHENRRAVRRKASSNCCHPLHNQTAISEMHGIKRHRACPLHRRSNRRPHKLLPRSN